MALHASHQEAVQALGPLGSLEVPRCHMSQPQALHPLSCALRGPRSAWRVWATAPLMYLVGRPEIWNRSVPFWKVPSSQLLPLGCWLCSLPALLSPRGRSKTLAANTERGTSVPRPGDVPALHVLSASRPRYNSLQEEAVGTPTAASSPSSRSPLGSPTQVSTVPRPCFLPCVPAQGWP